MRDLFCYSNSLSIHDQGCGLLLNGVRGYIETPWPIFRVRQMRIIFLPQAG